MQIKGYAGSYATLYRHFKYLVNFKSISKYKPSIRFETEPGKQAQVDWGSFGKIKINNKLEQLYCFVCVLGFSRAMYIEFTIKQNLQTFEQCHIHAFEQLGIPQTIVYDNMKTVVLRREKLVNGIIEPHYNPAFLDFTQHYGFLIKLCPVYWPRAKGKVESGVKYVRNNFAHGINFKNEFSSLEELNKKAAFWIDKVANVRTHRTTGEKPSERWLKEKPYLRSPKDLPVYETSPLVERNSTKDGLIQYKQNYYSVPPEFSRRKLFVKEINKSGVITIEIYYEDQIIVTHLLSTGRGEWIVEDEHLINSSPPLNGRKPKKTSKREKLKARAPVVPARPLTYYDQLIPKS